MGSKWVSVLGVLVFMFVSLEGCLEEERVALLQLKHFFNDPHWLQDWVEGEKNSDCCQWERVKCNNPTGRVIELDLWMTRNRDLGGWYLNASLFSTFQKLASLYLMNNSIIGFAENGGLDKLSGLSNLKSLNLGYNMFNNDILSSLHALSSLTKIYLDGNRLKGTVVLQDLPYHLQNLKMANNEIDKIVFPEGLDNLESLDLSGNKLNNSILSSVTALTSLRKLSLSDNGLEGIIDVADLDPLSNLEFLDMSHNKIDKFVVPKGLDKLEYLDLSGNKLNNSILSSVAALTSLRELYLGDNGLEGIVNVAELYSLSNLETLDMSDNKIDKFVFPKGNKGLRNLSSLSLTNVSINDGSSLLQSLGSFPSLKTLDLGSNNFIESTTSGDLPNFKNLTDLYMDGTDLSITFLQLIGLMTSLELLSLSSCGLQKTLSHQDGDMLAEFLYNKRDLQYVDLSHNNLTGEFPNWLLENNTKLGWLYLTNNSLGGSFQLPIHPHLNLTGLYISNNLFHGHIPKEIGEYLPSLHFLNLSRNDFDGSIPSSFGDMNSLAILDLSHNQLSGKIPEHLVEGCTSLLFLILSNNSFQGQIFSSNFNLTNLLRLQLDDNNFTGNIPSSLFKASNLEGLYLSANNLSGRIPSLLGNMSSLIDIVMPNNHLEGPIPSEFCQLINLKVLDLEANNISGSLPSCLSSSLIEQLHLSKNRLEGQLKDSFFNSSFLLTLDLSYNQLYGSIPTLIGGISKLIFLLLNNNNLVGEVPIQLCQLNQLRLVDLSHNNLSGHIPHCLDKTSLHEKGNIVEDFDSTEVYNEGNHSRPGQSIQIRRKETIEFTTKNIPYHYQGKVLTYMSGIDLSCNKLTGSIPQQIGNLTRIHALNLSHNNLTGPIPLTFSKLKQIESLDLSYNNLSGNIPRQLVELNALGSFSVAHNNLSGKIPDFTAQFSTFDEKSYEGNRLLCGGPPLNKSCDPVGPPSPKPRAPTDHGEDSDFIDLDIFYMSFTGSYVSVLLGIAAVLYINPYWRRAWFYLIETWMTSCYYFVVDNLAQLFNH
ncbi:hypothetical protein ACOSP7_031418 [Xanthoceras sorbifolium]